MNKPKWYNWVGDSYWDDYCKFAWIFIFLPFGGLFGLIIVVAFINTIRGVS